MTYEEAWDKLTCILVECSAWCRENRLTEIFETAVKALEKQIPKKPIERFALMDMRKCCPVCGDVLCRPYPCTCGQAIDWSE